MATAPAPQQVVSFEELLMSHVISQKALTRLLIEKGVSTKDKSLKIMGVLDQERKLNRGMVNP